MALRSKISPQKRAAVLRRIGANQPIEGNLAKLGKVDNVSLYNTLREHDAVVSYEQALVDATAKVGRLTKFRGGSPQFKEAMSSIISSARGDIQKMTRRAVEHIHAAREANGDPSTKMIWVGERDSNTCAPCRENFGRIETYEVWNYNGLPGADTCLGGDRCRCHLVSI